MPPEVRQPGGNTSSGAPAHVDELLAFLAKLAVDLMAEYESLEAAQPDKLAPIPEQLEYMTDLAELTGKRDLVSDLQAHFRNAGASSSTQ